MSPTGPRDDTLILKLEAMAPDTGAWLVVDRPGHPGRWIEIGDRPLVVGKGKDCAVILDDPHVSNRHAELFRTRDGVVLRDLGSSNGTRIANMAIKEAVLSSGTEITVGTTKLRFELGGDAGKLGRLAHEPLRDDELDGVPPRFGGAVGSSRAMRRIFALLARLAPTDLTITLLGETGTGKDVLARAIHATSPRASAPFIVFDCTAVPHSLIESELFGHEKGAFTSAVATRAGVFERADRGTLFIDEIGELPLELQPKLLRALEARQVQRLGGGSARPFDVRIVAASNRNLASQVEAGAFRQDLFFRLSTAILQVPPLREHADDIPDLIALFLTQMGRSVTVTPPALAKLRGHAWPGNVRELRNVINAAAALAKDAQLDVKDLVFFQQRPSAGAIVVPVATSSPALPTGQSLQEQEKAAIQQALQAHGGNRTHAARSLGIAISTLYTKIKKYCLNQGDD
jgi:DNA-binding NtrC family response regulator